MNTSMDSLSIEIQSVARDSSKAVDTLIAKLDQLRTSLQNVIKESNGFSQLKNNLEVASKTTTARSSSANKGFISAQAAATDVGAIGDLGDSSYAKLQSTITRTNSETQRFILNNNNVLTITKRSKNGVDDYTASMKKLAEESSNTSSKLGSLNFPKIINFFSSVINIRLFAEPIALIIFPYSLGICSLIKQGFSKSFNIII